jgi:DNA-binding NarL/FixJ family response regulator
VADSVERSPQHREDPSELETRVLAEKTVGLSDLEVAAKLMLSESTVRSIVRKHGRHSGTRQPLLPFVLGRKPAGV